MGSGKLGIIGYGNMGSAIISGLVNSGMYGAKNICVVDVDPEKNAAARSDGCVVLDSIGELGKATDIVIVAVKPGMVCAVLEELGSSSSDLLIISVAAGISTDTIESVLPDNPVIRVMPNTPALLGQGASALFANTKAAGRLETALTIFSAVPAMQSVSSTSSTRVD